MIGEWLRFDAKAGLPDKPFPAAMTQSFFSLPAKVI
jgi:hypothetical protein